MEESLDILLETYKNTMKLGSHTSHSNENGIVLTIRYKYPTSGIQAGSNQNRNQSGQNMHVTHPGVRPSLMAYRSANYGASSHTTKDKKEL